MYSTCAPTNLLIKKKYKKFPINMAIIKVNQSVNNELRTVAFLTYAAVSETNK